MDRRNISAVVLFLITHFLKQNFSTACFEPFSFALPRATDSFGPSSAFSLSVLFHPGSLSTSEACLVLLLKLELTGRVLTGKLAKSPPIN